MQNALTLYVVVRGLDFIVTETIQKKVFYFFTTQFLFLASAWCYLGVCRNPDDLPNLSKKLNLYLLRAVSQIDSASIDFRCVKYRGFGADIGFLQFLAVGPK